MVVSKATRIKIVLVIDTFFFLLELICGFLAHSLALTADAFHMLNDIISLIVGLWAVNAAKKEASDEFSFGLARAEILGAFFNAVFLIALCVSIVLEALTRFLDPPDIENPQLILAVGIAGLVSNLIGFLVLHNESPSPKQDSATGDNEQAYTERSQLLERTEATRATSDGQPPNGINSAHATHNHTLKVTLKSGLEGANIGMKALILHVIGDALSNIGVIIAALVIWLTNLPGKMYCDPLISLLITGIILKTAIPLTQQTSKILLQAVPKEVNVDALRQDIEALESVLGCHHIHVWQLSESKIMASLHVKIRISGGDQSCAEYMRLIQTIRECVSGYGIQEVTVQSDFS